MSRRIIDVHNHPNWTGHNIDNLVRNMDRYGIEKTWLLSWEISEQEFSYVPDYHMHMDPRGVAAPLSMVVEGLERYPDRFIGGWAPDPRDRYVRAKIRAAVKIHGIKVYGELKCRMRYDDPDAIATFRYCGQIGLPVLFHLQGLGFRLDLMSEDMYTWIEWYGGEIDVVDTMCRMCPETIFIGHGPGFWSEISGDIDDSREDYPTGPVVPGGRLIDLLRKYPNLYCDLSAGSGCNSLKRDPGHGRKFVLEFQDRILFGRDCFDRSHMDIIEKLDLPEAVLDKIYLGNGERLMENAGKKVV